MGIAPAEMRACGGGARSPFWRQMMADVFALPVRTVKNTEGPALGAAILGGVAAGMYADIPSACAALIRENASQLPDVQRHVDYEKYYDLYVSLYPALKDAYHTLARL